MQKKNSFKNLSFELDFLSIRLEVSAFWKRTNERTQKDRKNRPIERKKTKVER
jgi:hypothetical protein